MITYLLPTRDRHDRLRATLDALGSIDANAHNLAGGAEVIIVDNASDPPVEVQPALANGFPVQVLNRPRNEGAAARNIGVEYASGDWIIMLDDDSYPLDSDHIAVLREAPADVAAIGADITLPDGARESGGLPEVFIGCGVAIRRDAFLQVGGYDLAFDYYAEEYDLCAKLLLAGWRIVHDLRFRIRHEKITAGRDMNRILHRLVRNNGWIAQRYAPPHRRDAELNETVSRYARIAMKENAACGFALGMAELLHTLNDQPRREMPAELFDRFTGLAHIRQALAHPCSSVAIRGSIAIVDEGKNAWAIRQALRESSATLVNDPSESDALIIGTLSPGPMLDAFERRAARGENIILPWIPRQCRRAQPVAVD